MRPSPLTAIGLLSLAAANALLLAVFAVEMLEDADGGLGPTEWSPKLAMATAGVPQVRAIADYGQILAHPVFFKSREPFVAPPPAPPVIAKPPPPQVNSDPGLVLAGVLIGEGHRKAYLVSKGDARGTWASEGEVLSGWTVQSVGAAAVKLQQQDRVVELLLYPPQ